MKKTRKVLAAAFVATFIVAISLFAACTTKTYTLSFDTDGGTAIADITAAAGANVTPPENPQKEGYEFEGWYDNKACEGAAVEIPTKMPEKNVTYYAKYSVSYTVKFMDGETELGKVTGKAGTVLTAPDTAKQDYAFKGWYANAEGTGDELTIPQTITENATYYAKYARVYTLTFMYDGEVVDKLTDEAGAAVEAPEMDPVDYDLDNHDFLGWYATENFEGEAVAFDTMAAENKTYYAKIAERALVRYHDNRPDGNETVDAFNYYVGDEITVADADKFSFDGYLFLGWTTEKNGKVKYGEATAEGEVEAGATYKVTKSTVNLYAQWAASYTNNAYTGTLYVSANVEGEGGAVYKDGDDVYLGTAEYTPVGDLEFTITVDGKELIGMVNNGAFYLRNSTFAGYYQKYDWMTDKWGELDLYVGGYIYTGGSGTNTFNYCDVSITEGTTEHIGYMQSVGNEFYFMSYDKNDSFTAFFSLYTYDEGKEFVDKDGKVSQGYFKIAGEEGNYASAEASLRTQKYVWVANRPGGSIGWPETEMLYDYSLFLDGYGYAEIMIDGGGSQLETFATGTYAPNGNNYEDCFGEWVFTPDDEYADVIDAFTFKLTIVQGSTKKYLCWWEVTTYTNGNASITFKDNSNATYTDANGNVKTGTYVERGDENEYILFTETVSGQSTCFIIDGKTKSFEVAQAENGFIIKNGVVITYVGTETGTAENPLVIPDSATAIADYAFQGTDIKYIYTNKVTTIGVGAFFTVYSLVCVTVGESIQSIDLGAFAYGNNSTSNAAFTVIFLGNNAPKAGASLFMNRTNVTVELASADALRSFWAEDSWEKYISYFHLEQSGNEAYYGTYVNSSLTAIVVGETTTVNGVTGLFIYENGNVTILAYDKSQPDNYSETTATLANGVLTVNGVKYYKLAAGTELTFTATDGSTLKFTFPGTAEFNAAAIYTPAGEEAEEVALFVEFGKDGIEVVFIRDEIYAFNVTLNYNPEGQNTFTAEYVITKIYYESYDYYVGNQDEYDYFNMYLPYYGAQGFMADGRFESIKDANGKALEFSKANIFFIQSQASGNITYYFYGITFTHTDGYYYYLQLQTATFSTTGGSRVNLFFVGWYRATIESFDDGDFTVEVYRFAAGTFESYAVGQIVDYSLYENGELAYIYQHQHTADYTTIIVLLNDGRMYTISVTIGEDNSVTGTVELIEDEGGDE